MYNDRRPELIQIFSDESKAVEDSILAGIKLGDINQSKSTVDFSFVDNIFG